MEAVRLPDTSDGYRHVRFTTALRWVRGSWRCTACQTVQTDYCTGGENVLTCLPCPGCGREDDVFVVLSLVGLVDGEEIDFKDLFLELVDAEVEEEKRDG